MPLLFACNDFSYELVERRYKIEKGKETLIKEIFWEDFDKKIKSKEVEYKPSINATYIDIYSDSLLTKSYMIDNYEGVDTFNILNYRHDELGNIIEYIEITDDKEIVTKCDLTLDSTTLKPTSIVCYSSEGEKYIVENVYYVDRKVSRTFVEDSLIFNSITYFNQDKQKIGRFRNYLSFSQPMTDSSFFEYVNGNLMRETKYFNDTLSGFKNYFYKNDTLVKIISNYSGKDSSTVVVKYFKN